MASVSPAEISALIDGELTAERAEEVRRALVEDQRLQEIYQQMARADSALSSFAAACQFELHPLLPNDAPFPGIALCAVAFGLLVVRILTKMLPFGPGMWLQALAIAVVIAWVLYRLLPTLEADLAQGARGRPMLGLPPETAG